MALIKLKILKALKAISITSYLLIILMGDMIGIPFVFWLFFNAFNFGELDQLFAILGVGGVVWNIKTFHEDRNLKNIFLDLLSFIFMLTPLVSRLVSVPIELFNYLAFIIPICLFVLLYLVSIGLSLSAYFKNKVAV